MLPIRFAEIPEEGLLVNVNDVSWFPDDEVTRHGAPRAVVSFARNGEKVIASGAIEMELQLACDRCLAEFVAPLRTDFRLLLEVGGEAGGGSEPQDLEYEYGSEDFDLVTLDAPVIDLGDLLYQQVLLALPQKNLCRPDCKGVCGHCGASLNDAQCDCSGSDGTSSFAALGRLLKSK